MEIPIDERYITDEQLLSAFDLTLPGLEKVSEAFACNNISSAKKHLCDYFYNRQNVKFLFDYRGSLLKKINPEENPYAFQASLGFGENLKQFCIDAGKKMMRNVYVLPGEGRGEIDLGTKFENMIHFNFLTDSGTGHRHHLDLFVRGQFFEYLAIYYHETGDKSICSHFKTILYQFIKTYPLIVEDTSPGANRFQYNEDRDAMSVGFLALSYITLLYTKLPYDAGEDVVFDIIKHLWFLGLQFRRFDTDSFKPYNHHMWERGLIPFMLATLLPEIPDFTIMQKHGADIVCQHVKDDFNLQGGYNEHSIAYWAGAALGEMLYRGVCISRLNSVTLLDDDAMTRIDKSFDMLAAIAPPAERYPPVGDNRGPLVNAVLKLGIDMTGNAMCQELLTVRTQGKSANLSVLPLDMHNDKVGFVCMHSDFKSNSSYVLISTKTDCGASGHNHMDMLSLFITVRGKQIIGEPYSDYLYRNAKMSSPQRGYFYNMSSHNTVLAFGQPVVPDRLFADKWGVYRYDSPVTSFKSEPQGAYASAWHAGYPHCRHTRKLLFSRKGNILIRDEIARGNRVSEPHIQRWHLDEGCVLDICDSSSAIVEKEGVRLLFLWDQASLIKETNEAEILCPAVFPTGTKLAPVLEAHFSNMDDNKTDLLMVPLNLLIYDITDSTNVDVTRLKAELATLALQMDSPDAVNQFSKI